MIHESAADDVRITTIRRGIRAVAVSGVLFTAGIGASSADARMVGPAPHVTPKRMVGGQTGAPPKRMVGRMVG